MNIELTEKLEKEKCPSCNTKKFETWRSKKDSGNLTGTRCINKCFGSYTIDQEQNPYIQPPPPKIDKRKYQK